MKNKTTVIITIIIICLLIAAAGLAFVIVRAGEKKAGEANKNTQGTEQMNGNTKVYDNRAVLQELFANKQDITIDCLGDSITWGMFATDELYDAVESGEIETGLDDGGQMFDDFGIYISGVFQSDPTYPEVLESELNSRLKEAGFSNTVKTFNDGICGDWITEETYQRMSVKYPDVVVLLMGGNNYHFDLPIDGMFEPNIQVLRERGAIIYLANYPLYPKVKIRKDYKKANEYMVKIAEKEQLPLIDLEAMMEAVAEGDGVPGLAEPGEYTWDDLFSPDHVHLSEKGYELVGKYIADTLWSDFSSK